jgi:acetyl-CoA C-acetyltransferase
MHMDPRNAVIVSAARTPVGKKGRSLADKTTIDLGMIVTAEALRRAGTGLREVDEVIFGNCGQEYSNVARCIVLAMADGGYAGLPDGQTVNRNCGSGHQAIMTAASKVISGERDVVLAGGTESMSRYSMRFSDGIKVGNRLKERGKALLGFKRDLRLADLKDLGDDLTVRNELWYGLSDPVINMTMPATAEKLARQYRLDRQDLDAFAVMSHTRAAQAQADGRYDLPVVPVDGMRYDECVQRNPSLNDFTKEPRIGGAPGTGLETDLITALNACPTNDGAAAVLIMSEETARRRGLPILAYIAAYESAACDPSIMGIGPTHAIRRLPGDYKRRTGRELGLGGIQQFEINEAFASVVLANSHELDVPLERINPYGGAIALGHPVGATGCRITADLVYTMVRDGTEYAVNAACVGGGQGVAILLHRPRDAPLATYEDVRKHQHPDVR